MSYSATIALTFGNDTTSQGGIDVFKAIWSSSACRILVMLIVIVFITAALMGLHQAAEKKLAKTPSLAKGDVIWECTGEGFTASLVTLNIYHGVEADTELRVRPAPGYVITRTEFTPPPSVGSPATLAVTSVNKPANRPPAAVPIPGSPVVKGRRITILAMRLVVDQPYPVY